MSTVTRAGAIAVLLALAVMAALTWHSADEPTSAGFWFADGPFTLFAEDEARIGGPLTESDRRRIEQIARAEVARAFAGMRLEVVDGPAAFWRVEVVQDLNVTDQHIWRGPPSGAADRSCSARWGAAGPSAF